jgi:glyoxylase-like metal-dependent hydrolase (beta-lactamase superfamily II)
MTPLRTIVLAALLLAGAPLAAADRARSPLRLTALAEGVHLVSPVDSADRSHTNALVVEQAAGRLVVNAQPTPAAAREMLALLAASLPRRDVRYLVLAHPHADAAGGASAFPAETVVVATEYAAQDLADADYDFGAEARARAGDAWTSPPRPRVELRLQGNVVIDDVKRQVILIPAAAGHSRGDLLVEVPSADLLAVGSLLFEDRNPWAGTATIGGWVGQLNNLASWGRKTFVPLEGAPVDADAVRRQREAFAWTRGEIDAAFVDRTPPDDILPRVLASPRAGTYFDLAARPSFARGVVEQALLEAHAQRRKFGLE